MKRWQLILLLIVVVALGLWFVPIFPDPYHHKEKVNFWIWLQREIDELIHGERE